MKKKINIVTFYNAANYGAFLQAFSTQNFLMENDYDARIYEYSQKTSKFKTFLYGILKRKKALKGKYLDYNNKILNEVLCFQSKLVTTKEKKCDVTIIGSDEVWNLKNFCAPHNMCFFEKNNKSGITISYAACSGKTNYSKMKSHHKKINGLKNIDYISVRDDSTEKLVDNIGRKDVTRVLDPTFLYNFDKLIPKREIMEPYLLVYSYGLSKNQIDSIKKIASENNLKVVVTGYYAEWADYNPTPNPFEWLSLIKYSNFVVTSTFHFSIQLEKNFAVYGAESLKIHSVLKEFKLLDRRITQWNSLSALLKQNIDYVNLNIIKNEKISSSKKFLLDSINNCYEYDVNNNSQINAYFAKSKDDDVVKKSRSGGLFTELSNVILKNNGVVFGAKLCDDFSVKHVSASTLEERNEMLGSKYVQSDMSNSIDNVISLLKSGKKVLFSGTSCQVNSILSLAEKLKIAENLLTIDFICHGVPSPLFFKNYIDYFDIDNFNFRDKNKYGWHEHYETGKKNGKTIKTNNAYTNLYYNNYITRPSCHECPFAKYKRYSDITIADGWGYESIDKNFNKKDFGISLIIINTKKGEDLFNSIVNNIDYINARYENIEQPVLECAGKGTTLPNINREIFWDDYTGKGMKNVLEKYLSNSKNVRIKNIIFKNRITRYLYRKMKGRV